MTLPATAPQPQTSFPGRIATGAALASGTIGIAAAGLLIGADQLRAWRMASRQVVTFLFASHDVATIFQSLLLIPAIVAVHMLYRRSSAASRASVIVSVTALSAIALLQSLRFTGMAPETLYMLPQGLLGLWLIVINRFATNIFPPYVRRIGMLAGLGLTMIAASLLTVILYFGLGALTGRIRAGDSQARRVNQVLHVNLDMGTFLGKPTYPIWVLLAARKLRRQRVN